MTLLALDIGNSHTTVGLFAGSDLVAHWRVQSDDRRTADEWFLLLDGLVAGAESSGAGEVTALAVCCTVPAIVVEVRAMAARYHADARLSVVGPGVRTGVPIHTDNPREVGADRIVNALAAHAVHGGPCVVVDMNGTATIVDVVDAEGAYLGGVIAPGVELSLAALSRRGAQLRSVELAAPRRVVGKNTVEALQSGVIHGFAGQVDGIVRRVLAEMEAERREAPRIETGRIEVVVTGSFPDAVVDACETITVRDPWLTLTGLRLVHERNL